VERRSAMMDWQPMETVPKDGTEFLTRECSDELAAKVVEVASNPHEAAKAYGERTGNCSVCGRTLRKHASIDAKIGPICTQKYGW
jgi:hypothetical protein